MLCFSVKNLSLPSLKAVNLISNDLRLSTMLVLYPYSSFCVFINSGGFNEERMEVIHNCGLAQSITNMLVNITSDEFLLHIPVTTTMTNITYANVYCAICNHEAQFWFWNVKVGDQVPKVNM